MLDLSQKLSRAPTDPSGFLVSDFTLKDYQRFLAGTTHFESENVLFYVCTNENKVCGFLIAYDVGFIKASKLDQKVSSEQQILKKFGDSINYFVVKQLAVADDHAGKGIAQALYRRFAAETLVCRDNREKNRSSNVPFSSEVIDIFTAVLSEPANDRSLDFHAKMGYEPVSTWATKSTVTTSLPTVRLILHNTSQHLLNSKNHTVNAASSAQDGCESARQISTSLYQHEDNLNWVKQLYLTQYTAALIAGQFVIASAIGTSGSFLFIIQLLMVLSLGGLAIFLASTFQTKIRSGLLFMHAHKRSVMLLESKLAFSRKDYYPSVIHVPLESDTVKLIDKTIGFFQLLAILSTIINVGLILSKFQLMDFLK